MLSVMIRFAGSMAMVACFIATTVQAESFAKLEPDVTPGYRPALSETEGGIWMAMDDFEESLKYSPNRFKDPELDAYLKEIICRLSPDYCPHIRVYVVRMPHFNASMAPNGMMQVWTGLLLRIRNEAQLSAVLGHEIGHFLKRHSIKRFEDIKIKNTILTFLSLGLGGAVAAGGVNADVASGAIDATRLLAYASIFAYSRDQEREADKYGIQLMTNSGHSLEQAPVIWENLITEQEASNQDDKIPPVFFSTHPNPEERIKNLRSHAEIISQDTSISRHDELNADAYWKHVSPHMTTLLEDEINLHQFGRTEYLLQSLLENRVQTGLVNYYLGELYRMRGGDGDIQQAKEHYQAAIESGDYPAETHRSLGLLHYKDKEAVAARDQFTEYLDIKPGASDREMIRYYILSLAGN